jgi:hypothetical protein
MLGASSSYGATYGFPKKRQLMVVPACVHHVPHGVLLTGDPPPFTAVIRRPRYRPYPYFAPVILVAKPRFSGLSYDRCRRKTMAFAVGRAPPSPEQAAHAVHSVHPATIPKIRMVDCLPTAGDCSAKKKSERKENRRSG